MRFDNLLQDFVRGLALLAAVNQAQNLPPARMMGRPIGDRLATSRPAVTGMLQPLAELPAGAGGTAGIFGYQAVDDSDAEDSDIDADLLEVRGGQGIRVTPAATTTSTAVPVRRPAQARLQPASASQLSDLHMAIDTYFARLVRSNFDLPQGHPYAERLEQTYAGLKRRRLQAIDRQIGALQSDLTTADKAWLRLEMAARPDLPAQRRWLDRSEQLQQEISALVMAREPVEASLRSAAAIFRRAKAFGIGLQDVVRTQVEMQPDRAAAIYQAARRLLDRAYGSLFAPQDAGAMVDEIPGIGGYLQHELARPGLRA